MSVPAVTFVGAVLTADTSATALTVVFVVELEVLGPGVVHGVGLLAVAVLLMVEPSASEAGALTTRVKTAEVPAARVVSVQEKVPVPPAAGTLLQANPVGGVSATKVVPAGTMSVTVTVWASLGP